MINVICSPGLWARYRHGGPDQRGAAVRGTVEKADNVVSVLADRLSPLDLRIPSRSRDFR